MKNKKVSLIEPKKRIRNYCRIRPYDGVNKSLHRDMSNSETDHKQVLLVNKSCFKPKIISEYGSNFSFDYIFDEEFTQLELFQESCVPLIDDLVEHKKSSLVMTQGLSDSGKTFTIMGDSENPGILPLSLRLIYDKVREKGDPNIKIFCNFFEISQNKTTFDLLSENPTQVFIPKNNNDEIPFKGMTFFKLENIQDFSNALNLGNKRKKMHNKNSMSNTFFKLILRFFDDDQKYFTESSMTILDTVFPDDRDFIDARTAGSTEEVKENSEKAKLYNIQLQLTKSLNHNRMARYVPVSKSDLTKLLRFSFYGDETLVLITNIKPSLELNEENLKVLLFSKSFVKLIDRIDANQTQLKSKYASGKKILNSDLNSNSTSVHSSGNSSSLNSSAKSSIDSTNSSNHSTLKAVLNKKINLKKGVKILTTATEEVDSEYEESSSNYSEEEEKTELDEKKKKTDRNVDVETIKSDYEALKKKFAEQDKQIKEMIRQKNKLESEGKLKEIIRMKKEQKGSVVKLRESIEKIDTLGVHIIQNNNTSVDNIALSKEINTDLKNLLKNMTLPSSNLSNE